MLDAERMDLDDDSVDGATCRWGFMLMADPAAAFKETRRVLRDEGPLAFAVWTAPDRNPWVALPGMTLVQRGVMPPPEPDAPGMFALGEEDRLRELLNAAGFAEVELEEIRSLCDRVLVIYEGEIVTEMPPESSEEDFGVYMTGGGRKVA